MRYPASEKLEIIRTVEGSHLPVKYTDEKRYFASESSAYRILKAADLITAPD